MVIQILVDLRHVICKTTNNKHKHEKNYLKISFHFRMMNSMAKFFRETNLTYSSFAMDSTKKYNFTEDLKREVGLDHSSK